MTDSAEAKKKRPDCYECKHRGGVLGSAHSSCHHPKIKDITADPMGQLLATFASVGKSGPIIAGEEQLGIRGTLHGIKKGWFNWPFNYDPVWLETCDGFTKKGKYERS